tara:strand:+ start:4455 stop:5570 length:1116 start_codon:yes stop_codon:yes gene_type:complete
MTTTATATQSTLRSNGLTIDNEEIRTVGELLQTFEYSCFLWGEVNQAVTQCKTDHEDADCVKVLKSLNGHCFDTEIDFKDHSQTMKFDTYWFADFVKKNIDANIDRDELQSKFWKSMREEYAEPQKMEGVIIWCRGLRSSGKWHKCENTFVFNFETTEYKLSCPIYKTTARRFTARSWEQLAEVYNNFINELHEINDAGTPESEGYPAFDSFINSARNLIMVKHMERIIIKIKERYEIHKLVKPFAKNIENKIHENMEGFTYAGSIHELESWTLEQSHRLEVSNLKDLISEQHRYNKHTELGLITLSIRVKGWLDVNHEQGGFEILVDVELKDKFRIIKELETGVQSKEPATKLAEKLTLDQALEMVAAIK